MPEIPRMVMATFARRAQAVKNSGVGRIGGIIDGQVNVVAELSRRFSYR